MPIKINSPTETAGHPCLSYILLLVNTLEDVAAVLTPTATSAVWEEHSPKQAVGSVRAEACGFTLNDDLQKRHECGRWESGGRAEPSPSAGHAHSQRLAEPVTSSLPSF